MLFRGIERGLSKRHEFELASEDGEGQGSLACCSPWGRKESDVTEQNEAYYISVKGLVADKW